MRRGAVVQWMAARGNLWHGLVAILLATTLFADAAEAQRRGRSEYRSDYAPAPRGHVAFSFIGADPVGELGLHIDQGFGGQLETAWALDRSRHLRLRADLGFIIYGHERQTMCFGTPIGCRIGVDLTTTNSIFFGGLGPELVLATGAIEPYVNASFGFAYFATTSSLSGDHDNHDFASTTNYSDANAAWRAGGGLRVRLSGGRRPVRLDVGAERHNNGVADFLTEGDIVDHPDGSVTLYPRRSEADLVTFRVGISIGIPQRSRRR
jgi:hypothetical protein